MQPTVGMVTPVPLAAAREVIDFRPYVRQVIYGQLDCGDLHNGFARAKCADWDHEYLLPALSCKRRHFCHNVFKMLLPKQKITDDLFRMLAEVTLSF